jgi:uncharacterized protein
MPKAGTPLVECCIVALALVLSASCTTATTKPASTAPTTPRAGSTCVWPKVSFASAQVTACRTECDVGDMDSCTFYGVALLFGRGTAKDEQAARPPLERACDAQKSEACHHIGGWLEHDPARAVRYLDRACNLGSGPACDSLAIAYEDGRGVAADVKRAFELRKESCSDGFKLGCANLGVMYENGKGVAADPRRALELFESSCTAGDVFDTCPCLWAALALERGVAGKPDPDRLRHLFRMACDGGHDEACQHVK